MGITEHRLTEASTLTEDADQIDLRELVAGSTAFATALYLHIARNPGNVFFAPSSISAALAMTYAGARGETATEMARALRLPALDPARLHAAFGALAAAARGAPGVEVAIANALFGQRDGGFLPDFLALLAEHYGGGLREVDFCDATEQACRTINQWVEQQTKGKIVDLVSPALLQPLTRLVLVNAIYFKGSWAAPFPEEQTVKRRFFHLTGESSPVPLMHRTGDYRLIDIDDGQMIELPYAGDALSLVAILPWENDGLSNIERKLAAKLDTWLEQLDGAFPEEVDVYLPRFRIDASLRPDAALQSLGMSLAFGSGADFSGMNGVHSDLYIGAVLHKAFVDVNEQGTTAAAATAVIAVSFGGGPPAFRADHPFVFLIRDARTKSVLFLGRLVEPNL